MRSTYWLWGAVSIAALVSVTFAACESEETPTVGRAITEVEFVLIDDSQREGGDDQGRLWLLIVGRLNSALAPSEIEGGSIRHDSLSIELSIGAAASWSKSVADSERGYSGGEPRGVVESESLRSNAHAAGGGTWVLLLAGRVSEGGLPAGDYTFTLQGDFRADSATYRLVRSADPDDFIGDLNTFEHAPADAVLPAVIDVGGEPTMSAENDESTITVTFEELASHTSHLYLGIVEEEVGGEDDPEDLEEDITSYVLKEDIDPAEPLEFSFRQSDLKDADGDEEEGESEFPEEPKVLIAAFRVFDPNIAGRSSDEYAYVVYESQLGPFEVSTESD